MLTRIVRTGLASTVSTPAIPAAWTMCVMPFVASVRPGRSSTSPWTKWKLGWSPRSVPESASRWRLSNANTSFVVDEPPRERRPDEAGAAGDQDLLAAQSHAASVPAYPLGHASRRLARHARRSSSPARRRRAASSGMIDLRITFQADASTAPRTLHPPLRRRVRRGPCRVRLRRAAACASSAERAFRPTPPDMGVRRHLRAGRRRHGWRAPTSAAGSGSGLRLVNGCEIARWHRVGFLLPPPASGAS